MTKRKQHRFPDEPNLKRFRTEIKSLTKSNSSPKHGSTGGRSVLPKQSRKQRRKEARLEKKSRKNAYSRKMPVSTI